MKKASRSARLNSRVPVSTTEDPCPEQGSHTGPVGLNALHEARLITSLVEYYGWTLCTDGNQYNPYPGRDQEELDAA